MSVVCVRGYGYELAARRDPLKAIQYTSLMTDFDNKFRQLSAHLFIANRDIMERSAASVDEDTEDSPAASGNTWWCWCW